MIDLLSQARTNGAGELVWVPYVLATASIPRGSRAWVRGIRQYLEIAALIDLRQGQLGSATGPAVAPAAPLVPATPGFYVDTFEVTSPRWSFQDAGVRWHLSQFPGDDQLVHSPRSGTPFAGLGNFYDIRYRWQEGAQDDSIDFPVHGRNLLVFWAEVLQSSPKTRPTLPFLTSDQLAALGPEERFVANFPQAIYSRIAGVLVVEYDRRHGPP